MDEPDIYDPKYWKWSTFYYNPHDQNRFAPKQEGLGLTPNFAHKSIWFMAGGILIITLILVLYNLNVLPF